MVRKLRPQINLIKVQLNLKNVQQSERFLIFHTKENV